MDPILDLKTLGTPCSETHLYYERMRFECNDIIKYLNVRENSSKSNKGN